MAENTQKQHLNSSSKLGKIAENCTDFFRTFAALLSKAESSNK